MAAVYMSERTALIRDNRDQGIYVNFETDKGKARLTAIAIGVFLKARPHCCSPQDRVDLEHALGNRTVQLIDQHIATFAPVEQMSSFEAQQSVQRMISQYQINTEKSQILLRIMYRNPFITNREDRFCIDSRGIVSYVHNETIGLHNRQLLALLGPKASHIQFQSTSAEITILIFSNKTFSGFFRYSNSSECCCILS